MIAGMPLSRFLWFVLIGFAACVAVKQAAKAINQPKYLFI